MTIGGVGVRQPSKMYDVIYGSSLKRENDMREAELKKKDKEEADLRRMISELQNC